MSGPQLKTATGKALPFLMGKAPKLVGLGLFAALMASCQSSGIGSATDGLSQPQQSSGGQNATTQLSANPVGEVFGNGPVRIAMLIPKSAPGNAATVANELRNGALLAMKDFGQDTIQLVIKDTKGTAADAQNAASQAVSEGSTAILGPLFSANVAAASGISLPAGKTIIAFSSDPSVAKRGVYLLSYTPAADTQRMINYALSTGKRNLHAFLPNTPEGTLREGVLRQLTGQSGANLTVTKYDLSGPGIETAARSAAVSLGTADALYIPDGGQIPEALLKSLAKNGAELAGKQVIGSGQWESVNLSSPLLVGALFSGRDTANVAGFEARYQQTYNVKPGVFGSIAYDAVTLSINLIKNKGPQEAFTSGSIEDRRGFAGINGVFRFKNDGTAERGLAIYEVRGGRGEIVSPAPSSFSAS